MGATNSDPRRLPVIGTRVKRWPAYLVAFCWPGAGHVLHRQWARGCSWALLCGVALVFLSGGPLLEGSLFEPPVVTVLRYEGVTFGDVAVPLAIIILNVLDLYLRALYDRVH